MNCVLSAICPGDWAALESRVGNALKRTIPTQASRTIQIEEFNALTWLAKDATAQRDRPPECEPVRREIDRYT